MTSPNRNRPETMISQWYDFDPVTVAGAIWAPKTGRSLARGVLVITAGTLVVDAAGSGDWAGIVNGTIPSAGLVVGEVFQMAITKIYASSTGTFVPLY